MKGKKAFQSITTFLVWLLLAGLSNIISFCDGTTFLIWFPLAVAILAIYRIGKPAIYPVFIAAFIFKWFLWRDYPYSPFFFLSIFAFAFFNTFAAFLGTYFLKRKAGLKQEDIFSFHKIISFSLFIITVPAITGALAAIVPDWIAGLSINFQTSFITAFCANFLSIALIIPFEFSWRKSYSISISSPKLIELLALTGLLLGFVGLIITNALQNLMFNFLLAYLLTPLFLWLAIRFESRVFTLINLLIIVLIFILSNYVVNSFPILPIGQPYIMLQGFGVLVILIVFLTHSFVKDRLLYLDNLNISESRFREIIENMPVPLAILLKNGQTEYINSDFEKLTSFKLHQINTPQKWFFHLFPNKDYQNEVKENWKETLELIAKVERIEREYKIITAKKEEKLILFSLSHIQDKVLVTLQDITHRKKMLSLIRESERKQAVLLKNLQGMVFQSSFEKNFNMTFVSDGALNLTGYLPSQFTEGHTISFNKLIVERFRDYVWETIQSAVKNKEPYELQYQILTREGKQKWVSEKGTGLYDEMGVCYGIESFLTDNTERIKMLDNLILSEQKYRSLFENMPVALWEDDYSQIKTYLKELEDSGVTDLHRYFSEHPKKVKELVNRVKIIDLNKESVKLYEAKSKEELLRSIDQVFVEEDYTSFSKTVVSLYKGTTNIEKYISHVSINGINKTLSVSWFVMPGHEQNLSRVLVSINDISELREAEHEIRKLNQQLEEKVILRTRELDETNKELEAFSYSVSHDLKAPLRAIKGFSELLSSELEENTEEKVIRYLSHIRENSDKMTSLINDLLQFSRLGRKSLKISEINTRELVNSIWTELISYNNNIKAVLKIEDIHPIKADLALIRQVFTNILSNSLKFTTETRAPEVIIKSRKIKGFTEFSISDNGIGFDQKFEEKIFKVFQRLHTNDEYEGSGIGLALVKRIIMMHGGQIWAKSKENQGTEFIFTISVEIDSE